MTKYRLDVYFENGVEYHVLCNDETVDNEWKLFRDKGATKIQTYYLDNEDKKFKYLTSQFFK